MVPGISASFRTPEELDFTPRRGAIVCESFAEARTRFSGFNGLVEAVGAPIPVFARPALGFVFRRDGVPISQPVVLGPYHGVLRLRAGVREDEDFHPVPSFHLIGRVTG